MSFFFFSSRRRHTRLQGDWSSDVCSSDLYVYRWRANGAETYQATNHRDLAFHGEKIGDHPDRKSTRLNSSHLVISYAVFCLEKIIRHRGTGCDESCDTLRAAALTTSLGI